MIQAVEQKQQGFHAFRLAPPIAKTVMDPFLQISFVEQRGRSFARPQAGYTTVFIIEPQSEGSLIIETGTLGKKELIGGSSQGLFCGRGVLCRTSVRGTFVRYVQVDIKITQQQELLDAHWRPVVGHIEKRLQILDHNPYFSIACSQNMPDFWKEETENIRFVGSHDGSQWSTSFFPSVQKQWYFVGEPLQEPIDTFSSLALSDRVRNRLALLDYKRGDFGTLAR